MEKKLAVIVDNKEVTTEAENTEMCSVFGASVGLQECRRKKTSCAP